jgi:N-methylhydantoinase B
MMLVDGGSTLLCERRTRGPAGARGGEDGAPGVNTLISGGRERILPGKASFEVKAGDVISIQSPGGGGWGSPGDAAPRSPGAGA